MDQGGTAVTGFVINAATGAITYTGSGLATSVTSVIITVAANSDDGDTEDATVTVTVNPATPTPNVAPVATLDQDTATENGPAVSDNVLTNDDDPDGDNTALEVSAFSHPDTSATGTLGSALQGTYGLLTLNADGSYTYVVNRDLLGAGQPDDDAFSYTVTDERGGTHTTNLFITVTGADDAPTLASAGAQVAITTATDTTAAVDTGYTFTVADADANASTTYAFDVEDADSNTDLNSVFGVVATGTAGEYKLQVKAGQTLAGGSRNLSITANNGSVSAAVVVVFFVDAIPTVAVSGAAQALSLKKDVAATAEDTGFVVALTDNDGTGAPALSDVVFKDGSGADISGKFTIASDGSVSIAAGATFATEGDNVITVEYTDDESNTVTTTFTIAVAAAAPQSTALIDPTDYTVIEASGNGASGTSLGDADATNPQLIFGKNFDQTLNAGKGGDVLIGGHGRDTIELRATESGVDTVVIRFESDTLGGLATDGGDTVNNFELEKDRLVILDEATTPVTEAQFFDGPNDIFQAQLRDFSFVAQEFGGIRFKIGEAGLDQGETGSQAGADIDVFFTEKVPFTVLAEIFGLDSSTPAYLAVLLTKVQIDGLITLNSDIPLVVDKIFGADNFLVIDDDDLGYAFPDTL